MHNTLIICGVYQTVKVSTVKKKYTVNSYKITYTVDIFGQTLDDQKCVYIATKVITCDNYSTFIDECIKVYQKYFNTSSFNIVTIDRLSDLNTLISNANLNANQCKSMQIVANN